MGNEMKQIFFTYQQFDYLTCVVQLLQLQLLEPELGILNVLLRAFGGPRSLRVKTDINSTAYHCVNGSFLEATGPLISGQLREKKTSECVRARVLTWHSGGF